MSVKLTYKLFSARLSCLLFFVYLCTWQCDAVEITVEAATTASLQPISSNAILICSIHPSNASIMSRWITPNGSIISGSSDKYSLTQGSISEGQLGTVLAIQNLSYKDAGAYTCEVIPRRLSVSSCECDGFPRSATIELSLQVNVEYPESQVTVTERSKAVLRCEMSGYISPDEDLLWFKDDGLIYNGFEDRFQITFTSGTLGSAQDGRSFTTASRISMLEISASILSDSGGYFCRVRGRNVSAAVSLFVVRDVTTVHTSGETLISTTDVTTTQEASSTFQPDTTSQSTPSSERTIPLSDCKAEQSTLVAITFGITFVVTTLLSLVLTTTVVCLGLKLWQRKEKLANKASILPPVECVNGRLENEKVTSAVNLQALELESKPEQSD